MEQFEIDDMIFIKKQGDWYIQLNSAELKPCSVIEQKLIERSEELLKALQRVDD